MSEPVDVSGEYSVGSPLVVAVGSASRDITAQDPRGWRLGGGVTYGALALARLGLPVGALIGVDAVAATAWELDLLRDAGALVQLAPLPRAPVFEHQAGPDGRRLICHERGDALVVARLPAAWRSARAWLLAPVAAELPAGWGRVPDRAACVALGWQGLLRHFRPGSPMRRRPPRPTALLARADLVGVSATDLDPHVQWAMVAPWIGGGRDDGELVVTAGAHGGIAFSVNDGKLQAVRRYPGLAAREEVDPTGAGDVFLATLLAVRLEAGDRPGRAVPGAALRVAAAAASLAVAGPGVVATPSVAELAARLRGTA